MYKEYNYLVFLQVHKCMSTIFRCFVEAQRESTIFNVYHPTGFILNVNIHGETGKQFPQIMSGFGTTWSISATDTTLANKITLCVYFIVNISIMNNMQ